MREHQQARRQDDEVGGWLHRKYKYCRYTGITCMKTADKDEDKVVEVTERWLTAVLADRALFEDQNLVLADRMAALLLRVESSEHTNALLLRCIQDAFRRKHEPRRRSRPALPSSKPEK